MTRVPAAIAVALVLQGCSLLTPEPITVIRVDTLVVTREVPPPLPQGDTTEICLSTGVPARVLVSAAGDTLIGDARVRLSTVRPVLTLAGTYAAGQSWYERADTLRFEKRLYRRGGAPVKRLCDELKLVGAYAGVPVFADVTAPQALPTIVIPVKPGVFQNYQTPARR